LFYGNEKQAIHTPVAPLGFSEFLTRVRVYNQNKAFKGTIRTDQAAAFYNRQSIVQIFYRIPSSQHKAPTIKIDDPEGEFPNRKISLKHVRLSRPEAPFQEMQLDTFFLPNTQASQRRGRELQREGLMSGESATLRRVLVSVDVTSRVLDAKMALIRIIWRKRAAHTHCTICSNYVKTPSRYSEEAYNRRWE
jgi:hypothetical protein